MTCKSCLKSFYTKEVVKVGDKTCEKCENNQFHTRYKDGKAVAWVCSKCKDETPQKIKKAKAENKED